MNLGFLTSICSTSIFSTLISGTTICGVNICGSGTVSNATCLNGQLASCYARKDIANTFAANNCFGALTGSTSCFTTCSVTPVVKGSTCICSPVISGTTCVGSAIIKSTTCSTTLIACATTCSITPVVKGSTCVCTPIVSGTTCVSSPINNSTTCSTTPISCATTCSVTPVAKGSTCLCTPLICGAITCAATCVTSPYLSGSTYCAKTLIKSDGIICVSNPTNEQLRIGYGVQYAPYISFYSGTTRGGFLQYEAVSGYMRLRNERCCNATIDLSHANILYRPTGGTSYCLWHANNSNLSTINWNAAKFIENGTCLASTYLGINATASNSNSLCTINGANYIYGANGSGVNTPSTTENLLELAQYKAGFWNVSGAAWTPGNAWWWGVTLAHSSNTSAYNYGAQIAVCNGDPTKTYVRTIAGGASPTASAWCKILFEGEAGGISWSGTTVNGIATYHNATTAVSEPNLTFNGTVLNITGIGYASTCLCSSIVCGTTCIATPIAYASTRSCTPIVCATTCVDTLGIIDVGSNVFMNSCAATCIYRPISNTTGYQTAIIGQQGASTSAGGDLLLRAGSGGTTSGVGGDILVYAGGTLCCNGGCVFICAGNAVTCCCGGHIYIKSGYGTGLGGNGGNITIDAACGYANGCIIISSNSIRSALLTSASNYLYYGGAARICTTSAGMTLAGCGTATDWIASSDCRLKTDIKPISNAITIVSNLCGVSYCLCCDSKCEKRVGLIAQDVYKVLPEVVAFSKPDDEDSQYGITDEKLGIKYDKLTAVLIEAIKEQQVEIQKLKSELNNLKT